VAAVDGLLHLAGRVQRIGDRCWIAECRLGLIDTLRVGRDGQARITDLA